MSEDFIRGDNEKLSFKAIVLQHLQKILSLSTNEFIGGYWRNVVSGSMVSKEYVPDSRACYIQAVESLASILHPHFDDTMKEQYMILSKVFGYTWTIYMNDYKKTIEKYYPELKDDDTMKKSDVEGVMKAHKLKDAKLLFIELNELLYRQDYLKASIYGEEE